MAELLYMKKVNRKIRFKKKMQGDKREKRCKTDFAKVAQRTVD